MRQCKIDFGQWSRKQMETIAPCYSGTNGEGERSYFSILKTCARKYPEHLEEFAAQFNRAKCAPMFTNAEVKHKIQDALRLSNHSPRSFSSPGGQWVAKPITYNPTKIQKLAGGLPEVTKEFLWWRSPLVPDAQSATSFLGHLFRQGDYIFTTAFFKRKEPSVLVKISPEMYYPLLEKLAVENKEGVWFLPNPITGQEHEGSMRNKAALSRFPYCVIESDVVEASLWLRFIVTLPLPIAAIYTSGGKSIHTLLWIKAQTAQEWEEKVSEIIPFFVEMGADKATMRPTQLSRLPQCMRAGKPQELLYLNPCPDARPIIEKPPRERRESLLKRMDEARQCLGEDSEPFPLLSIPEGGEG